jgi:K+-sensing histidine kinase KdpD
MKKNVRIITVAYWFLLVYIIAALGWWYIALQKQNQAVYKTLLNDAKEQRQRNDITEEQYQEQLAFTEKAFKRKNFQYMGEGITFFLLIILGAAYVYRSLRKQIKVTAQQQNFLMAVTHELKTPIAVTKLNLETILKRQLSDSQKEKLIQNTINETNRLNDLISNILLTSQIDGGSYILNKDKFSLSELVQQTVREFMVRFPNRKFEAHIDDDIYIVGDKLLLSIAINNLVENAIKYSPKESTIYIDLSQEGEQNILEITDEGFGIPDEEKRKVFDKFYRVGNENTRKTKGTGLGLFLTRRILEDHNADISLTDNTPHGSIFAVNFKKYDR